MTVFPCEVMYIHTSPKANQTGPVAIREAASVAMRSKISCTKEFTTRIALAAHADVLVDLLERAVQVDGPGALRAALLSITSSAT